MGGAASASSPTTGGGARRDARTAGRGAPRAAGSAAPSPPPQEPRSAAGSLWQCAICGQSGNCMGEDLRCQKCGSPWSCPELPGPKRYPGAAQDSATDPEAIRRQMEALRAARPTKWPEPSDFGYHSGSGAESPPPLAPVQHRGLPGDPGCPSPQRRGSSPGSSTLCTSEPPDVAFASLGPLPTPGHFPAPSSGSVSPAGSQPSEEPLLRVPQPSAPQTTAGPAQPVLQQRRRRVQGRRSMAGQQLLVAATVGSASPNPRRGSRAQAAVLQRREEQQPRGGVPGRCVSSAPPRAAPTAEVLRPRQVATAPNSARTEGSDRPQGSQAHVLRALRTSSGRLGYCNDGQGRRGSSGSSSARQFTGRSGQRRGSGGSAPPVPPPPLRGAAAGALPELADGECPRTPRRTSRTGSVSEYVSLSTAGPHGDGGTPASESQAPGEEAGETRSAASATGSSASSPPPLGFHAQDTGSCRGSPRPRATPLSGPSSVQFAELSPRGSAAPSGPQRPASRVTTPPAPQDSESPKLPPSRNPSPRPTFGTAQALAAHPPPPDPAPPPPQGGRAGSAGDPGGLRGPAGVALQRQQQQATPRRLPCNIKWDRKKVLGKGSCGAVYLGFDHNSGAQVAVKEVDFPADLASDPSAVERLQRLQREIKMLQDLEHPNIVRYLGLERRELTVCIMMEFVPGGSVLHILQKFGALSELVALRYTSQLLCGLHCIHQRNIMHRDIKGANVMVDQWGTVKLTDFGNARQLHDGHSGPKSLSGTPYWMAPEVIRQSEYGLPADVWSVGATVIEMVTAKPPWGDLEPHAALFTIGHLTRPPPVPCPEDGFSLLLADFVRKCFQKNPGDRPPVGELLQHEWITDGCGEYFSPVAEPASAPPPPPSAQPQRGGSVSPLPAPASPGASPHSAPASTPSPTHVPPPDRSGNGPGSPPASPPRPSSPGDPSGRHGTLPPFSREAGATESAAALPPVCALRAGSPTTGGHAALVASTATLPVANNDLPLPSSGLDSSEGRPPAPRRDASGSARCRSSSRRRRSSDARVGSGEESSINGFLARRAESVVSSLQPDDWNAALQSTATDSSYVMHQSPSECNSRSSSPSIDSEGAREGDSPRQCPRS
eukprot:TRINITY_DN7486_c0_g1_i2.p1 TRINITY_DN7486_c0_g1~~TRINITY_DN7486_c0_g1_i2.p1  ORF type:complete len:1115 (+),score=174.73 TRINITY_DN7486_c0_g1_i2:103-3447(+)